MPSTYSNIKIQLMATGENNTTWGNVTNINLGTALEEAIVGSADVTFASGNVTLTLTDTNASQSARHMRLRCTGVTGGSTRDLIVPAIEKPYIVQNDCLNSIVVKNATGTGITVPAGKTMWVYNDGTNVVDAVNHLSSLTLGTDLTVADGGTGASTFTANGVIYGNTTSPLLATAAGTTGQVLVGNTGGAPSWATLTGIGVTSFSGGTTGLTPASPTTGAITLAGTLGVANGGTGTTTAFTAGSVVFAGASGVYSQDNANLFWDDTNNRLGIGTATPSAPFHVKLTTDRNARFLNAYSSVAIGSTTDVGAEAPLAFFANPITFVTNNVERMRVDASGNVGIATSSPTALLTVNGTAKVGEGVATNTSKFMVNTLSGVAAGIQLIQDANESWIIQNPASTNVLTFSNSGTERMRITAGGNVGIGTTTPGASLEISSTFDELFRLTSTGSPYASWYTGATRRGYIQAQAGAFNVASDSAIPLILATNATERMRITDTGLVGIGTSSPEAKLTVAGTAGTISGAGLSVFETSTGNNARLRITQSAGFVTYDATYSAGGNQQVWSNAGTERMRLTEAGNLLVGTTTALSRLTVGSDGAALNADAITIFGSLSAVSTGQAISWYQNTASVRSGYVALNTNSGGGESELHFGTTNVFGVNNATTKMVILGGGNVGIGTTSPTVYTGFTTLEIDNASNGGILSIKKAGSVVGYLNGSSGLLLLAQSNDLKLTTTGATSMQFTTNATERMRITSAGDVGIGTTSPISKFEVTSGYITSGTVSSTGGAKILAGQWSGTEHLTTFGSEYSSGGPALGYAVWPSTTTFGSFVSAASAPSLDRGAYTISGANHVWYTGATQTVAVGSPVTMTERMRIASTGAVGIGTATPGYKLEVRTDGASDFNWITSFNNTAVGAYGAGFIARSGSNFGYFYTRGDGAAYVENAGAFPLGFATNGTERMRIDSSGNVMIGTTAANNKFLVTYANPVSVPAAGAGGHCTAFGTVGYGLATGAITNGDAYLQATRWDTIATNYNLLLQPNGGDVGIGTTSPVTRLEVVGNQRITKTGLGYEASMLSFSTPSETAAIYRMGMATGGNFAIGRSDTATTNITLNSSGNVGIGTSSPVYKLVVSDSGAAGIEFDPATGIIQTYNRTTALYTNLSIYGLQQRFFTGASPSERMRIDSSGDLLVGTTSAAGSMANTATTKSGVFNTLNGTVSAASGAATTIATANQNYASATYIVSCSVSSGAPNFYSAVAIVSADNNVLRITNLQTATNMTISISGTDIQATQTSGGTTTIIYSLIRIG